MLFYPMAVAVCALSGVGDTVVLDFQADWCGPCRSMQPVVQRLEANGYPVRQVNIDHEPDLARQYNVSNVPCFVAVVDGRERGRQVGASGYEQLAQMVSSAGVQPTAARTAGGHGTTVSAQPVVARGQSPEGGMPKLNFPRLGRRAAPTPPAAMAGGGGGLSPPVVEMPGAPSPPPSPPGAPVASGPAAAPVSFGAAPPPTMQPPMDFASTPPAPAKSGFVPLSAAPMPSAASTMAQASEPAPGRGFAAEDGSLETRLLKASVRIRVEGANDMSLGSGTIIDQRQDPNGPGGEALVLTCAHIFRESQGKTPIRIERFDQQMPQVAEGHMLRYDLERDVALITFRVETPVTMAKLAAPGAQSQQSDRVISIGCDNGQPPTARRSQIIAINKIQGAPNLQVAGQPAVGRSGGGLFDVQGRLIGVCNFADPQDRAGLYADVVSGHELLAQAGLGEISKASGLAAGDAMPAGAPASPPPMPASMPRGMGAAVSEVAATTTPSNASTELICVVRTGSGSASHNETIIISNASPDLLNRLAAEHRGGQAAFPTSLEVPREPQPQQAPPQPKSDWQPQWR